MPIIERVVAVVVTYNPDVIALVKLLEMLLPQVAYAIVVDNASLPDMSSILARWKYQNIDLLRMPENYGVAAAQNAGIERAMNLGADYILLSDQDSCPSTSMVTELLAALMTARADQAAPPVAAVGPVIIDRRTGLTYYMIDRMGLPRKWMPAIDIKKLPPLIEVASLPASGTLIPIEVIKRIGAMRSNYFIDHVDTEWCTRAKASGYRVIGVPASRMEHQFGDACKRVWFFGFRRVIYHSPLRNYYMIRNTLLMIRDTTMSWPWRIHYIWRLMRLVYFLLFAGDRWLRLRRMIRGLQHALKGLSGRLEIKTNRCRAVPSSDIEPGFRNWEPVSSKLLACEQSQKAHDEKSQFR